MICEMMVRRPELQCAALITFHSDQQGGIESDDNQSGVVSVFSVLVMLLQREPKGT